MKSSNTLRRSIAFGLVCFLARTTLAASPFCADTQATREYFHRFCDYVAANKTNVPVIFTGGYYMRDLVAGYHIFGDKRYLHPAVAYADWFSAHRLALPAERTACLNGACAYCFVL